MVSIALQAQLPGGKTKASDFSDADIKQMVSKAQSAGLSEGQVIQLAKTRGLSDSEIQAFEARVKAVMGGDAPAVKNSAADIAPADDSKVENAKVEKQVVKPSTPSAPQPTNNTYGANWFDKNRFPIYSNASSVKAPDNYEIGPGDEIGITLYGNSYFNKVCLVDEGGRIDLGTTFGKVFVKGVTFQKLHKLLRAALGSRIGLNGDNLDISLAYSRLIHINLTGEVTTPGTYQMPAVNTVFNALVAAGGPSKTGSFRNIQIVRGGKVIETFDAYEFIHNPKAASYLQDGDFIMVQPKGKYVSLSGAVLRPAEYELKGDEKLEDLINWAGGYTASALKNHINITTYNGQDRTLYTLNTEQQKSWDLKNGDQVAVGTQNNEALNRIEISGPVMFPGTYEWNDSMTIGKLLKLAGGTLKEADLEKAFIIRNHEDQRVSYIPVSLLNPETNGRFVVPQDQLVIFNQAYYLDEHSVTIKGEVRNPQTITWRNGLTLGDIVSYSGGFNYKAELSKIELIRKSVFLDGFNPGDINNTQHITIDVSNNEWESNPALPGDLILVRQISNLNDQIAVNISGEIKHPGTYAFSKGENTLYELIKAAGGLTEFAYASGSVLTRGNKRVVLDLQKVVNSAKSEYNYILKDGDQLFIATKTNTLTIDNTDTLSEDRVLLVPYGGGKRAGYYIRNYSHGFHHQFKKKRLFVKHPGGEIRRSFNMGFWSITPYVRPGSVVTFRMPAPKPKTEKEKKEGEPMDWNKFWENLTTKMTAIATLWVLVSRI